MENNGDVAWDFGKVSGDELKLAKFFIRTGSKIEQKFNGFISSLGSLIRARANDERGLATVEYAIMLVAVAGFAGLMVTLLKSDWAKDMIQGIIEGAFEVSE